MTSHALPRARTAVGPIALAALIAVLALAVTTEAPAQAVSCIALQQPGATDPGTDSDHDGLSDFIECRGGNLPATFVPGVTFNGRTTIDTCQGTGLPRSACLDPNSPDVFAILVPDTVNGSRIPANPFQVISRPVSSGGLGFTVHPIVDSRGQTSDRSVLIGSPEKAPRCTETNSLATAEILGIANFGTPGGLDECVVRLLAAENFVRSVFTSNGFADPGPDCAPCVALKVWVINHEFGHMMRLRLVYDSRFGGHHYKTGSGFLHDQATTFRVTKSGVTFSIPSVVSSTDQRDAALTP